MIIEPVLLQVELLQAGGDQVVPVNLNKYYLIPLIARQNKRDRGTVVTLLRGGELLDERSGQKGRVGQVDAALHHRLLRAAVILAPQTVEPLPSLLLLPDGAPAVDGGLDVQVFALSGRNVNTKCLQNNRQ